jgi:phosphonate transport system substrate-binding protein
VTTRLRWASYLAPALHPLYEAAAARVGRELGVDVELTQAQDYADIGAGRYDLVFVCGLPFVEIVDGLVAALTPIAAPVPTGGRYAGRPIYYSDVVVAAGSAARTFADLRGCRWAFNETGSHSGYLVTLHHLARLGETSGFFGAWVDAGYHHEALRRVAAGEVDAAAIDSQVLEVLLDRDPGLAGRVRVVANLGPSPIQPLVACPDVPVELQRRVQAAVLELGMAPAERELMTRMRVERLVAVDDATYDPTRRMLETVRMAGLWTGPRPAGLEAVS